MQLTLTASNYTLFTDYSLEQFTKGVSNLKIKILLPLYIPTFNKVWPTQLSALTAAIDLAFNYDKCYMLYLGNYNIMHIMHQYKTCNLMIM